jgi:hypothetical protein
LSHAGAHDAQPSTSTSENNQFVAIELTSAITSPKKDDAFPDSMKTPPHDLGKQSARRAKPLKIGECGSNRTFNLLIARQPATNT